MAVSFVSGATTVFVQNPRRGNVYKRELAHATGRTAAGTLYVYAKGTDIRSMTLEFTGLRDDEKSALESFFFSTVSGPSNTFTYTDHDGVAWTARFLDDTLNFEEVHDEKDTNTTFLVGAVSYPTTTRKNPVWRVEFDLEVS